MLAPNIFGSNHNWSFVLKINAARYLELTPDRVYRKDRKSERIKFHT